MRIISGEFGGRTIRSVSGPGYRPATSKVRGAIFSMLVARGLDWEGLYVLDLFAGSGSLALEALSRGAAYAAFVEKSKNAATCISGNLKDLGLGKDRARVYATDLFKLLSGAPDRAFGLVFIDPPYGKDLLVPALEKALGGGWIAPEAFVLAEVEAGLALEPEAVHPDLELVTDRSYGQTRIVVWKTVSK
ncbi:16S rRNA (guanine(966)-N(2))-methyltransferase RsmD [Desulfovibrio ferrophilus]|uniref:Methyltransferase n=1 Tax=Desulfovibrio ferrophilus TaxID=241368 RepID=A0A2Z6AX97_9BACT|nr:16S rRNA (guanine(966)-N(2))-methyltransferase RsmD [Desulfovibrio ferrophilus]BBD07840.1 methyltransferase [Desulfovibrio ferrophilus]